ncbi:MAG: GAF domain-containing protein [Chitinophagaceae bacterium]
MFRFEGFGISSIVDITPHHSIENIRSIILNRSSFEEENYYSSVIDSLSTLVGNNDVNFGMLPIIKVNDKLVFHDGTCRNSVLIKVGKEEGVAEMAYLSLASTFFQHPKLVLFREITPKDEDRQVFLKMLKGAGIHGYALVPIFYNNTLEGVLEVYSTKKDLLNEQLISKLDPAMGLLSQLLKNNIDEFNDSIARVIKEKFTAIQPSVQWKFNDVAWHYIRDQHLNVKPVELEEIEFENVYPLYGAIDIRNSSIERNTALGKDLQVQFTILLEVLRDLRKQSRFGLIDEKIFLAQKYLDLINDPQGYNLEIKLNDFLQNNITPFLNQFKEGNPEFASLLQKYFNAMDDKIGIANASRFQLETSMNKVISSVNNYLEMMKVEIQQSFPCYFEKFRTDGVEYDIYIGQSITPDRPFREIYLKNLRLIQLNSMASIARHSHSLLVDLPIPVQTTQLIFVHSQPIDIKFRKDEKRFDVEGSYNIRYQIIKKRIDKVRIKHSKERLTQPNKIALVYFNHYEANEYRGYVEDLQGQHILANDLEELELEDLQGVNGLKALRVSVITD